MMSGGCLCGDKRFEATIDDPDAILCHCRMCQRWSGSVSMAFKTLAVEAIRWSTPPDMYRSSPIAERGHCARCGSALTFAYHDDPNCDVALGCFDDPSYFTPTMNFAWESRHDKWLDVRDVPTMRSDENDKAVKKWIDACGKLPD